MSIPRDPLVLLVASLWGLGVLLVTLGSRAAWPAIRDWALRVQERLRDMGYGSHHIGIIMVSVVGTSLGTAACIFALMGIVPGLATFALGLAAPGMLLDYLEHRRHRLLELQIPAAMEAMTTSLRAGLSIQESIRESVRFLPWPTQDEMARMARELALGADLDKVLTNARQRYRSRVYNIIASALAICLRQGGNLVETFERTSKNLRQIQKLEEDIRTKSAGAKMAAVISFSLPIGILGAFWIVEPVAVGMLFSTFRGGIVTTLFVAMNWGLYRWIRSIVEPEL